MQFVITFIAEKGVVSPAASQHVATISAVKLIIAVAAIQLVVATSAVQEIVAVSPVELVMPVAGTAIKLIVIIAAKQVVLTGTAIKFTGRSNFCWRTRAPRRTNAAAARPAYSMTAASASRNRPCPTSIPGRRPSA